MPEHQNIEWKESWRDEYLKWISGFANANGGTLFIGINDKGDIVGIEKAKKLTEDLPNKIKNMLGLLPEVNLLEKAGKEYIEIVVESSKSPVAYKGQFYLRRGSTNQLLDGIALSDFILEKNNLHWDELIIDSATFEDIDQEAIDSFKKEAKKSNRVPSIDDNTSTVDVLRNLNLLSEAGELKRGALILFGKNPSKFVAGAVLKIGRFGESPSELLSQELLEGNNFQLADKVIELLDYKYIIRNISYDGLTRVETPEYPFEAIREAIFNAIIHREYDSASITISIFRDSLEIWNDGLLNEKLSIEDLKKQHRSYPRHKLMANVLYKAGYIESWGRGTVKIHEECKKHGLPEPKIHEYSGGVAVTLYKKKVTASDNFENVLRDPLESYGINLTPQQKKVIDFVRENDSISSSKYQELFDVTPRTARRHLTELVSLNKLKKVGDKRGTIYVLS